MRGGRKAMRLAPKNKQTRPVAPVGVLAGKAFAFTKEQMFMSIAGKQWYRNNFLQSEEWKTFRSQVLADCGGLCMICGVQDASNDVHHIWYGEPSYTGARQFVVLCRECHSRLHQRFLCGSAKTEEEKQVAWRQFLKHKASLLSKRVVVVKHAISWVQPIPIKDLNKKTIPAKPKTIKCYGCSKIDDNLPFINPVTQENVCSKGSSVRLCDACFNKIKVAFPKQTRANEAWWVNFKRFVANIPKQPT